MRGIGANAASRSSDDGVTPVELLFDLAIAFALSEIARHLSDSLTWRAVAESAVMLVGVFSAWFHTSWIATVAPVNEPATRRLILGSMLFCLLMGATVRSAFSTQAVAFAIPLVVGEIGCTVWIIRHAPNRVYREQYQRTLVWQMATAPLWIAGVALPSSRLPLWGLAVAVDLAGTWLAHPLPNRRLQSNNVWFDADHMLERCRLLLIVAIGQCVVAIGNALAHVGMTPFAVLAGLSALVATVGLWSLYFGSGIRATLDHLEQTCDPIKAARLAGNALTLMVAGLMALAVAAQVVILRPEDSSQSIAVAALLFGGSAVGLLAHAWYLHAVPRLSSRWMIAGASSLVLFGVIVLWTAPYVELLVVGVTLIVIAAIDKRSGDVEILQPTCAASGCE